MSFPNKELREKCWNSRDVLWKCLDENPDNHELCTKFRQAYESSCPSQWVKHFDRKREYLKFKDRINEGSSPSSPAPAPCPIPEENNLLSPGSITTRNHKIYSSSTTNS